MKYPKVILFTGAGANASLDFSTTPQFLRKIKNDEIKISNKLLFNTFVKLDYVTDIEQVWYLLDTLLKFNDDFKESKLLKMNAKFQVSTNKMNNWNDFCKEVKLLKNEIEDAIFQEYGLDDDKIQDAVALYSPLIRHLITLNESLNEVVIVTTNYDRVIEEIYNEYYNQYNWNFNDGFISKKGRNILNINRFKEELVNPTIKHIQLHGSLRWKKRRDNIEKVTMEVSTFSKTHKEPILIYPGRKEINSDPFTKLYDIFYDLLLNAQYCIIIGTSFRDKDLNEIFINSLKNNKKLKLIIISPHAKETTIKAIENEFNGIKKYWDRLQFINELFDDKFDFSKIKNINEDKIKLKPIKKLDGL